MITCAYTICKNELRYVEKWLYYTKDFTYRCLLDTGSTDGTYEALLKAQNSDSNLIIEQKVFTPWRFDTARRYNLDMIPHDVEWCLSPDMDEYFSINVLKEMQLTINNFPTVTNIACDRLDLYSEVVRVGPPNHLSTNKIHRRHDYTWNHPIYEHLSWIHKAKEECEIYNPDIYLIHDQDFKKQSRPQLYLKMLKEEYKVNPTNDWCLWFLVNHYYREKDLENFILTACDFVRCAKEQDKKQKVINELIGFYLYSQEMIDLKEKVKEAIKCINT